MSVTPIRHGEHPPILPTTVCEACGSARYVVADHCHAHRWFRANVCQRCNIRLSYIDRRIAPKVEGVLLGALLALRLRCPECDPLGVADLTATTPRRSQRNPRARNSAEKSVLALFRLPDDLKAWLREQAKVEGCTMTHIVLRAITTYLDEMDERDGSTR
jgi:hypothetical protein